MLKYIKYNKGMGLNIMEKEKEITQSEKYMFKGLATILATGGMTLLTMFYALIANHNISQETIEYLKNNPSAIHAYSNFANEQRKSLDERYDLGEITKEECTEGNVYINSRDAFFDATRIYGDDEAKNKVVEMDNKTNKNNDIRNLGLVAGGAGLVAGSAMVGFAQYLRKKEDSENEDVMEK